MCECEGYAWHFSPRLNALQKADVKEVSSLSDEQDIQLIDAILVGVTRIEMAWELDTVLRGREFYDRRKRPETLRWESIGTL
jgi:hypothetical protein